MLSRNAPGAAFLDAGEPYKHLLDFALPTLEVHHDPLCMHVAAQVEVVDVEVEHSQTLLGKLQRLSRAELVPHLKNCLERPATGGSCGTRADKSRAVPEPTFEVTRRRGRPIAVLGSVMGRSRLHGVVISAQGAGIPKKCAHETSLAGGACGGKRLHGLRIEVRAGLTRRRSPDSGLRDAGLSTAQSVSWAVYLDKVQLDGEGASFVGLPACLPFFACQFLRTYVNIS